MTFYYYSTEYPKDGDDLEEFFRYDAHVYESVGANINIEFWTTDIAEYVYHEHDGWDWWKQDDEIKIHLWDNTRKYLGYFMAEYEVEPSFYTGNMVTP